jgi:hypothetical protein
MCARFLTKKRHVDLLERSCVSHQSTFGCFKIEVGSSLPAHLSWDEDKGSRDPIGSEKPDEGLNSHYPSTRGFVSGLCLTIQLAS